MRISTVAALMIITTFLLSACAQQQVAEVEDRGTAFYGRLASSAQGGYTTYQSSAALDSISAAPLSAPMGSSASSSQPAPFRTASAAPVAPAQTHTLGFQQQPAAAPAQTFAFQPQQPAPRLTAAAAANWQWPVNGRVTTRFGQQSQGIANEGITIAAALGSPIHAAASGEVAYIGRNVRDYGNIVILRHPGGELTSYGHAKDIVVNKGDRIAKGDVIGHVGQTGNAPAPELHFALREGTRAIDPLTRLPSQLASR